MFEDSLNLHKFAKTALPNRFVHTVGPIFLPREVEETLTSTLAREDNNENEIQAKEETHGIVDLCQIDTNVHECSVSVLEIGDLLVQWSHQKKE